MNLRLKHETDPVKTIHFPFKFLIGRVGFYGSVRKKLMMLCLLPLELITHIFGLGFGFCYWVFFI